MTFWDLPTPDPDFAEIERRRDEPPDEPHEDWPEAPENPVTPAENDDAALRDADDPRADRA